MDEERSDGELSTADEALRVLRAELSVAPSPGLEARVRTRIAERRAPRLRWAWLLPAAAVAILAVGVLVWLRSQRPVAGPAITVRSPARPPSTAGPGPVAERPVERPPVAHVPRPARRAADPVRPLVPVGEDMRIARYAVSVRQHPFETESLPLSDPSQPLAEPAPIEVVPLDTVPLVPDEGSIR